MSSAKATRRWVSVAEACAAIYGKREAVTAWLRARGLVRTAPWGAVGVDIEEAMRQLAHEAEAVAPADGPPVAVLVPPAVAPSRAVVEQPAPVSRPQGRRGRTAAAIVPNLRYEPIP